MHITYLLNHPVINICELRLRLGNRVLEEDLVFLGTVSLQLELLTDDRDFLLEMMSDLLNESLPLVILAIRRFRVLLPSENDEFREPVLLAETPLWQETFALLDHLQFGHLNGLNLLFHAVFVTLADHCDDEVHEHDISDNQYQEP